RMQQTAKPQLVSTRQKMKIQLPWNHLSRLRKTTSCTLMLTMGLRLLAPGWMNLNTRQRMKTSIRGYRRFSRNTLPE
ncbi:hypothetical protein RSAG8_04403, partial [Rhizoctonia solani AG-8 WAC10335]